MNFDEKVLQKAKKRIHFENIMNLKLYGELRKEMEIFSERIISLTPNALQFNNQWKEVFDIDVFIQLVEHTHVTDSEINHIVEIVFDRLLKCCAPVQDEAIIEAAQTIKNITDSNQKISQMFEIAYDIIEDIEKMVHRIADELVTRYKK
mgnify:CR=1 FL=1